jgi:hypothetical protein
MHPINILLAFAQDKNSQIAHLLPTPITDASALLGGQAVDQSSPMPFSRDLVETSTFQPKLNMLKEEP